MAIAKKLREAGTAKETVMQAILPPMVHREDLAAAVGFIEFAGDPTGNVTPEFIGQRCLDTTNAAWYMSHGIAAANWKKLTP